MPDADLHKYLEMLQGDLACFNERPIEDWEMQRARATIISAICDVLRGMREGTLLSHQEMAPLELYERDDD